MSDALDPVALRERYDTQLRAWLPERLPAGVMVEVDGPVLRVVDPGQRGLITYTSVAGVDDLDDFIARQRDFFAERGQSVEWKLHGHDRPGDLPDRLVRAGFVPEERETVVIGLAAPLADRDPPLPAGVHLREVSARADLGRIEAMEEAVWGEPRSHLAAALEAELAADASGTVVVVAEADATATRGEAGQATVVSAGWIRFAAGTGFATLWGGATLAPWRGRGIYRALVAYRAWLATVRGFTYLQVDASDDSRPILQRCGFVPVTTTTPYVHRPPR